jgi:hypothetical protein
MPIFYQTFLPGDATLRAAIVPDRGRADLLVWLASYRGLVHNEGHWFMTKREDEAMLRVWFCSEGVEDIKVYFVKTPAEAGWVHGHHMKGKLN